MSDLSLESQVKKTCKYWCRRLTWRWTVDDPAKLFDPTYKELELLSWEKLLRPEVAEQIESIWRNPDPARGGVRGVSKFVSVVCRNGFRDEHRKLTKLSPEILGTPLDAPTAISNGDGTTDEGRLIDFWTDETVEQVPDVFFEDLRKVLTSEEFNIFIDDHLRYGRTVREISDLHGFSKSKADRIIASAARKVADWGQLNKRNRLSYLIRLNQRTKLNPARIDPEVRDAWLDTLRAEVIPFFDCPHLPEHGWMGQNFDIGGTPHKGRYALCPFCWKRYWTSLCEQIERDIEKIAWELATSGVASGTNADEATLFISEGQSVERETAEIRKGQEHE